MKKMVMAAMVLCLAGCDTVVSLDELIARTNADAINSAHWLMYCGEENGLEYFRHESALPVAGGYYAVPSSELPTNGLRFPRTRDESKWKSVIFVRGETMVDGVLVPTVTMHPVGPKEGTRRK